MKFLLVCLTFSFTATLFSQNSLAESNAEKTQTLIKTVNERAQRDCESFQQKIEKSPKFFEGKTALNSCLINHTTLLQGCLINFAEAISKRVGKSDSTEKIGKVAEQERGVFEACILRSGKITEDEMNTAAKTEKAADAYIGRAASEFSKSKAMKDSKSI